MLDTTADRLTVATVGSSLWALTGGAGMPGEILSVDDTGASTTVATLDSAVPTAAIAFGGGAYVGGYDAATGAAVLYEVVGSSVDPIDLPGSAGGATVRQEVVAMLKVQTTSAAATTPAAGVTSPDYLGSVASILASRCTVCHADTNNVAAYATYPLTSSADTDADYTATQAQIDTASPADSDLLLKATNTVAHVGGGILTVGDSDYDVILAWIQDGAPLQKAATRPPRPRPTPSSCSWRSPAATCRPATRSAGSCSRPRALASTWCAASAATPRPRWPGGRHDLRRHRDRRAQLPRRQRPLERRERAPHPRRDHRSRRPRRRAVLPRHQQRHRRPARAAHRRQPDHPALDHPALDHPADDPPAGHRWPDLRGDHSPAARELQRLPHQRRDRRELHALRRRGRRRRPRGDHPAGRHRQPRRLEPAGQGRGRRGPAAAAPQAAGSSQATTVPPALPSASNTHPDLWGSRRAPLAFSRLFLCT
ncbi:MAG: hypothetical protein R3F62_18065 [Planctomycetota bacterium]